MSTNAKNANTDIPTSLRVLAGRDGRGSSVYLCGGVLGVPLSSNLLDHGILSLLPAVVAVGFLLAGFIAMVRCWGLRPSTAPTDAEVLTSLDRSLEMSDQGPDVEPAQGWLSEEPTPREVSLRS